MINVLHVGLSSNPGGIESCVMGYYRQLDKTAYSFDFVDIYGDGLAYENEMKELGARVYVLPNYKSHPLACKKRLKSLVAKNKYDVVHFHVLSAITTFLIKAIVKIDGVVTVVHSHNAALDPGLLRNLAHKMNLGSLRKLPVIKVACGEKAGVWLWGNAFDCANIITNAIDIEKFRIDSGKRESSRREYGINDDDVIIGFVGHLCVQKNVLFTAEILHELSKISTKYKLLIVGEGPLEQQLKSKICELGVDRNFIYVGKQSEMGKFYGMMDYFILPSLFEGFPMVAVEAQAAGLTCFVSDSITQEIKLTDKVKHLPIDNGAYIWAKTIDENKQSADGGFDLLEEYDIRCAVNKLQDFYTSACKEADND